MSASGSVSKACGNKMLSTKHIQGGECFYDTSKSRRMNKIKNAIDDKIFYTIVFAIVTLFLITVIYPLVFILSSSFSAGEAVQSGKVFLWPVGFTLKGYSEVLNYSDVFIGFRNTLFYTICGTLFNLFVTLACAYPLSRRDFVGRGFFSFLFAFTMLFGGGLIPSYLLMKDLHLINSVWVLIIPGAMSVYNMIVTRTFLQTNIPTELLEASQIDGCSDVRYFFAIVLPLSKAIIAVMGLFYAVGHWNAFFGALIYINDRNLYPLQLFLREILLNSQMNSSTSLDPELLQAKQGLAELLKYSLIVVTTVPILFVYPFVQKYFVKGIMVGSVKG